MSAPTYLYRSTLWWNGMTEGELANAWAVLALRKAIDLRVHAEVADGRVSTGWTYIFACPEKLRDADCALLWLLPEGEVLP